MNIDELLKEARESGEGWDGVNTSAEAARAAAEQQQRLEDDERRRQARIVAAALDNEAGRRFMLWLASKTIFLRGSLNELQPSSMEAYALAKAERAGQNALFFTILDALDVARGIKPSAEESGL